MSIQHQSIPDVYLHEPKGIVTALANTVYVANGTGSGIWAKISSIMLQSFGGDGGVSGRKILTDGANGFRTVVDSAQGQMFMNNNTNAFPVVAAADATLNTNTDYTLLTGTGAPWATGELNNVNFLTNRLSVNAGGRYRITVVSNITGFPTATAKVAMKYRVNGAAFSTRRGLAKSAIAADVDQLILNDYVSLGPTDYIQLYVASSASGNLVMEDVHVALELVAAT